MSKKSVIPIEEIEGIKIGHALSSNEKSGCTVILFANGATASVEVRGGAPGTRETEILSPGKLLTKIHGIFLSGGSAFGLDCGSGVVQYLMEKNIGFKVSENVIVPIVPGAVIFDLDVNPPSEKALPDKSTGYQACLNAELKEEKFPNCRIGAGKGAKSSNRSTWGGIGAHAVRINDLQMGAIAVVNCYGDVFDYIGKKLTGTKETISEQLEKILSENEEKKEMSPYLQNTTLALVITNVPLTKEQCYRISVMSHSALSKRIIPTHTIYDGDAVFVVSTASNSNPVEYSSQKLVALGNLATGVLEEAIISAVKDANK